MTAPLFRLEQVCKRHSGSFALDIEQLDVVGGETLCLVGPAGAGKSTLLGLLSGIDLPDSGRITFDTTLMKPGGWPLKSRRRITAVRQYPVMLAGTVRCNVEFGLRVRGERAPQALATRVLERLNLLPLARQDARTLSGGQIQLVALARALVLEPDVLLLDEPTTNLDPANVALVEEVIQDQRARSGVTIVWATHNLFQARRQGTRAGLLLGGKMVEVARTADFFAQPGDERTEQFVQGKMVY